MFTHSHIFEPTNGRTDQELRFELIQEDSYEIVSEERFQHPNGTEYYAAIYRTKAETLTAAKNALKWIRDYMDLEYLAAK
jgi:hypothetical protein